MAPCSVKSWIFLKIKTGWLSQERAHIWSLYNVLVNEQRTHWCSLQGGSHCFPSAAESHQQRDSRVKWEGHRETANMTTEYIHQSATTLKPTTDESSNIDHSVTPQISSWKPSGLVFMWIWTLGNTPNTQKLLPYLAEQHNKINWRKSLGTWQRARGIARSRARLSCFGDGRPSQYETGGFKWERSLYCDVENY